MSMKNSNDIIGNRTRDLPVCRRLEKRKINFPVLTQEANWLAAMTFALQFIAKFRD
jgi:hypothetical protein